MRGNGLFAASYAPVAELDPRIADVLLELLRDAGVAAYAEPSQGRRGPYLDVQLPSRPTDRLYVDRSQQERARLLLAEQLPELRNLLAAGFADTGGAGVDNVPSSADDAVWRQIVASYDRPTTEAVPRWPVVEDVDRDAGSGPGSPEPVEAAGVAEPGARRTDDDEHFVPPPPPPLPRLDPVTQLAWAALVGGPAVLLAATMFGWVLPRLLVAAALVAFIAGFVTLVVRMRDDPPQDWESDSGAVL